MVLNSWQVCQILRGCNMNYKKLDILGVDIKKTASEHWEETRSKRYRNYILCIVLGCILTVMIGG